MNRPAKGQKPRHPLAPALGLGILLLLALLATTGLQGYRDLLSARLREETLQTKIDEAEERIEALEERIGRLREDPLTLERLAREELGLVRPEDIVIVLPEGRELP